MGAFVSSRCPMSLDAFFDRTVRYFRGFSYACFTRAGLIRNFESVYAWRENDARTTPALDSFRHAIPVIVGES